MKRKTHILIFFFIIWFLAVTIGYSNPLHLDHSLEDCATTTIDAADDCDRQTLNQNGKILASPKLTLGASINFTPTVTFAIVSPSCNGSSDGTITATASSGEAPYYYLWNNGQTTATAVGLTAGNYFVYIEDSWGYSIYEDVTLNEPPVLQVDISTNEDANSCTPATQSSATVSGGAAPYTYVWDNGETTQTAPRSDFSGYAGVTVTDASGCVMTDEVFLYYYNYPTFGVTANTDEYCDGSSDGQASINISGGSPPYTYNWDNGETGQTATALSAGNHEVTVTTYHACYPPRVLQVSIGLGSNGPVADFVTPSIACEGSYIFTSKSTGASSFAWYVNGSLVATTEDLTHNFNSAGNYNVELVASDGACTDSFDQDIAVEARPIAGFISPNITCAGTYTFNNITINATTYKWTIDGVQVSTAEDLTYTFTTPGTYMIKLAALNDVLCMGAHTDVVEILPDPTVDFSLVGSICKEQAFFENTSTGASDYEWSVDGIAQSTDTDFDYTFPGPGSYNVTLYVEEGNCFNSLTQTFDVMPGLAISIQTTGSSATAVASGGTPNYSYMWSNGGTTQTVNNLTGGTYWVSVTDSNGCQEMADADIFGFSISGRILDCNGDAVGQVTVDLTGDDSATTTTAADGSYSFDLLDEGDYTITPSHSSQASTGLSGFDILLISRHILGSLPISDPCSKIAADVNESCSLTGFDMLQIQKLIQGSIQAFPSGKTWRFMDEGAVFTGFPCNFSESITISALSQDANNVNFRAAKLGDVNASATN